MEEPSDLQNIHCTNTVNNANRSEGFFLVLEQPNLEDTKQPWGLLPDWEALFGW